MSATILNPTEKDLGDLTVKRVLPAPRQHMVGPFIFFDHFGPAEFPPGKGVSVRPHPHIGIATITYMFEGEIVHRDSLGVLQPIRAGAVNLMTAGKGIVHSERSGDDLDRQARLHGIQSWIALPDLEEECEPDFRHYAANEIPALQIDGCDIRVIMGEAFEQRSPVQHYSPIRYLECRIPAGKTLTLSQDLSENGIYMVAGQAQIECEGELHPCNQGAMLVSVGHSICVVTAKTDCHCMVIGGEPLGERHIWWNFVSSSTARIEQAKADWKANRFPGVPGETEFIPLPE